MVSRATVCCMEDFGPLVSAEWLADNLDLVHIFDSRSYLDGRSAPDAFVQGHLPGAVFVSLDDDLSAPASQPGGPLPNSDGVRRSNGTTWLCRGAACGDL